MNALILTLLFANISSVASENKDFVFNQGSDTVLRGKNTLFSYCIEGVMRGEGIEREEFRKTKIFQSNDNGIYSYLGSIKDHKNLKDLIKYKHAKKHVDRNNAIYCGEILELFDPKNEESYTIDAIILDTRNTKHCDELRKKFRSSQQ